MTGGPSVSFGEFQTVVMDYCDELQEEVAIVPGASSNSSPASTILKKSAVSFLQQRCQDDCPPWNASDSIMTVDSSIDHYYNTAKVLRQIQEAIDKIPLDQRTTTFPSSATLEESRSNASMGLNVQEMYQHLISLRTEYIQKLARPLLQKFILHPKNANIFNIPVDPVALGLPHYFEKIKRPMDLGTIRSKLQSRQYDSIHQCFEDIRLVFQNAIAFNGLEHYVGQVAKELLQEFEQEVSYLHDKTLKEYAKKTHHACNLCHGALCLLCGEKCVKFDNPVLYCHAPSCGMKIKKNSIYFITKDGLMLWCQKCYGMLPPSWYENIPIDGKLEPRKQVKKHFLKRRFDEEIAEPWIECRTCHYSFHQVCAMYTSTFNKEESFTCTFCRLEEMTTETTTYHKLSNKIVHSLASPMTPRTKPPTTATAATTFAMPSLLPTPVAVRQVSDGISTATTATTTSSIASTNTSEMIVEDVHEDLQEGIAVENADNMQSSVLPMLMKSKPSRDLLTLSMMKPSTASGPSSSHWKAKDLPRSYISDFMESCIKNLLIQKGYPEVVDSITIRMTTNCDKYVEIPKAISDNMKDSHGNDLPRKMKYRQKSIQLFQMIDGIDVCLFCLYVQEFDEKCPPPNQSIVHIAYLDSVDFFRPMKARTMVYQEIVVSYLAYAKYRGFQRCHFWACPPQRGDNFIFWCHPSHQRTPSRDRLNAWYNTILQRCKILGIHDGNQHLWQAYFAHYSVKREENSSREAAKRSFVGSGKAASKKLRKTESGSGKVHCSSSTACVEEGPVSEYLESNDLLIKNEVHCPPIFEGDYWIQEYLRLHRIYMQKSRINSDQKSYANYRKCRDLIKSLINKPIAAAFRCPVDPVALQIPTYFTVIKHPMDLGTIRENMRLNLYDNMLSFAKEVRLTFTNAMTFNPSGHAIHSFAQTLLKEFEKTMLEMMNEHKEYLREDITLDEYLAESKLKCHAQDRLTSSGCIAVAKSPEPSSLTKTSESASTFNLSPTSVSIGNDDITQRLPPLTRVISEDSYVMIDTRVPSEDVDMIGDDETTKLSCRSRRDSMDSLFTEENNPPVDAEQHAANTAAIQQHYTAEAADFESFALVPKCMQSLLQDLSKSIHRLNDDLFVIKFNSRDYQPRKDHETSSSTEAEERAVPATVAGNGSRKRGRLHQHDKKDEVNCIHDPFPEAAMTMLRNLSDDTSDPDAVIENPLMESRYTFLEMCQYRHYQFDTLRRAKYSSLMILYHLHHPNDASIRPTCHYCQQTIHDLRWHCDECAGFDICEECKEASELYQDHHVASPHSTDYDLEDLRRCHKPHQHPLTPYRVTFR